MQRQYEEERIQRLVQEEAVKFLWKQVSDGIIHLIRTGAHTHTTHTLVMSSLCVLSEFGFNLFSKKEQIGTNLSVHFIFVIL